MSTTPVQKTQPVHFANRDLIFETGGVKFVMHVTADMTASNVNPPPEPNPVTPPTPVPPTPPAPVEGGIALDGVKMLFPENKAAKCKPFFINLDNPDENPNVFAVTYGSTAYKFDKTINENGLKYVRHHGAKQTYASGAPPGKSCRLHHTPDGGMFTPGKHSWKDSPPPEYLYSDKCFYNFEFTVIARPGKALGTHQSYAYKIRSRPDKPDDSLRSTIEFCMPNDQKPDAYVNYNYDHKSYEKVPNVKQYVKEGKITVNEWIGTKLVSIVADDRKSHWMGLYVNLHPIGADNKPDNSGWKLKAEYTDKGISAYKNIPCTWGGMTNYLRCDGYDTLDIFRYSIVEIEKGPLKNPALLETAAGVNFTFAVPPAENPADFNSPDDAGGQQVPQQEPSNPDAPPQVTVK
jgi:hypothetical protein